MTAEVLAAAGFHLWPERASSVAPRIDTIYGGLIAVSGALVLLLVILNLVFLIRYRHGSPAPRRPLRISENKFEVIWISVTTAVFLGIFFWGGWGYLDNTRVPADAHQITVVGRQWMWDARHPGGRREFNSLHVPVGQPVQLLLSSEDVIHSFFVPAFRLKADVVPGKQVSLWFQPTRTGRFHLFCAEFCGTKHAEMIGAVIVQTPEEHAAWLATGTLDTDPVSRGRALFLRHGCSGCHDPASAIRAPLLEGIYGRPVPLSNGTTVIADDRYLRDSILQPQREVAAGYEPIMPSFDGVLAENDLLDLLAYLKALRGAEPPVLVPQPVPTITPSAGERPAIPAPPPANAP